MITRPLLARKGFSIFITTNNTTRWKIWFLYIVHQIINGNIWVFDLSDNPAAISFVVWGHIGCHTYSIPEAPLINKFAHELEERLVLLRCHHLVDVQLYLVDIASISSEIFCILASVQFLQLLGYHHQLNQNFPDHQPPKFKPTTAPSSPLYRKQSITMWVVFPQYFNNTCRFFVRTI